MNFKELGQRAAAVAPTQSGPIIPDRTLYLDGDGLAYNCAGNDETSVADARQRTRAKVEAMTFAAGAGQVRILLTASGSTKGHRYALARVKPYQGQRVNSRRPKNWRPLRDMLQGGVFGEPITYTDREADDGFALYAAADPERTVIGTQDKDMRMCWGWHLNWQDYRLFYCRPGVWDQRFNELQYGHKWFWLQMLHGDTADFIPGLPKVGLQGKKLALCGPVTAERIIGAATDNAEACGIVLQAYESFYGDRGLVELLEQATLLWMRPHFAADWQCVTYPGAPCEYFRALPQFDAAMAELAARVKDAIDYSLPPQGE